MTELLGVPSQRYPKLDFSQEELAAEMRATYNELIDFVGTPGFAAILEELRSLAPERRPAFVLDALLQPEELARRGVEVPDGILIETSAFGDRRPTLFAVKKYLPERFHAVWENVNLTFDNEYEDHEVTRDPEAVWRAPLPVALQNAAIASKTELESFPTEDGVDYAAFRPAPASASFPESADEPDAERA